jgi:hypothetical protein
MHMYMQLSRAEHTFSYPLTTLVGSINHTVGVRYYPQMYRRNGGEKNEVRTLRFYSVGEVD